MSLYMLNMYMFKRFLIIASASVLSLSCTVSGKGDTGVVYDECGVAVRMDTTRRAVYLVFTAHFSTDDDGWFENFDGVAPVLDTLADRGVKGSFFPTGNCFRVEKYRPSLRRIVSEGHYLSGHSDRHLKLCAEGPGRQTLVSADSLKSDTESMESELYALGLKKKDFCWMIPPYEHYNTETAQNLRFLGYRLLVPTPGIVTGADWMGVESRAYRSAKSQVETIWQYEREHSSGLNGAIILFHAMNYPCRTEDDRVYRYLGEVIDTLREKGYELRTFKDI